MAIRVEFFGIARQRAGASNLVLEISAPELPLAAVLNRLTAKLPQLGPELISDGALQPAFSANIDGTRFVRDPQTIIRDGQSLLILSADAGG